MRLLDADRSRRADPARGARRALSAEGGTGEAAKERLTTESPKGWNAASSQIRPCRCKFRAWRRRDIAARFRADLDRLAGNDHRDAKPSSTARHSAPSSRRSPAAGRARCPRPTRTAIVDRLKAVLAEGRAEAERQLRADGRGTLCARRLSDLQDEIIRAIHDFAVEHVYPVDNPSRAERMAIVAVGGYGRGTLAPGSDIDLLFLLPYKQTPWGESVVEYILYMLWDLGQKVGHATRTVDECIRLARSDMTIRTAMLEARYIWGDKALFDELVGALRHRGRARAPAPNSSPPSSPSATTRHASRATRATWSSPTSRTARAACATSTRCSGSPSISTASSRGEELVKAGVFSRAELPRFRKCGGFPLGGALPPAFPHRPRRGAAVLRPPARDGGAPRLHRASRPARTSSAS